MRVTWCSNPCNLRNRGENSVPANRGETPENKIVWHEQLEFILGFCSFHVAVLNLIAFPPLFSGPALDKKRAKINGQVVEVQARRGGRFVYARARGFVRSVFSAHLWVKKRIKRAFNLTGKFQRELTWCWKWLHTNFLQVETIIYKNIGKFYPQSSSHSWIKVDPAG